MAVENPSKKIITAINSAVVLSEKKITGIKEERQRVSQSLR
jgi:pectinesterase